MRDRVEQCRLELLGGLQHLRLSRLFGQLRPLDRNRRLAGEGLHQALLVRRQVAIRLGRPLDAKDAEDAAGGLQRQVAELCPRQCVRIPSCRLAVPQDPVANRHFVLVKFQVAAPDGRRQAPIVRKKDHTVPAEGSFDMPDEGT